MHRVCIIGRRVVHQEHAIAFYYIRSMFRLDKNVFAKVSHQQADDRRLYWLSKTPGERVQAAIYLQSIVFGFGPDNMPRMDKTEFGKRKWEE